MLILVSLFGLFTFPFPVFLGLDREWGLCAMCLEVNPVTELLSFIVLLLPLSFSLNFESYFSNVAKITQCINTFHSLTTCFQLSKKAKVSFMNNVHS